MCRKGDRVARFGGEEFILAVQVGDASGFDGRLARLQAALRAKPVPTARGPVAVTASIGAACAEQGPRDFDALYLRVDKALYRAKRLGRDRVEFVTGED